MNRQTNLYNIYFPTDVNTSNSLKGIITTSQPESSRPFVTLEKARKFVNKWITVKMNGAREKIVASDHINTSSVILVGSNSSQNKTVAAKKGQVMERDGASTRFVEINSDNTIKIQNHHHSDHCSGEMVCEDSDEQARSTISNSSTTSNSSHSTSDIDTATTPSLNFKCKFCDKQFSTRRNLTRHVGIHYGKINHRCRTCGKGYWRKDHFSSHIAIHSSRKPYKCTVCSCTFSLKTGLKSHMTVHSSERNFSCYICNHTFKTAAVLRGHMQVHELASSDNTPFQCGICTKYFKRSANLRVHIKRQHDTDILVNQNPFVCSICKASFNTLKLLNAHYKYQCLRVEAKE